ncbi:uncharacterized protein TNCV_3549071 [Trichonephila clavipes]|nr:uncharacterized protein TNCV_3549071 [Trichonephila clavipes]
MLGRRIAARQPPPTCLPELRRALLDEWCNIPQDQIDNLILSIPRRYILRGRDSLVVKVTDSWSACHKFEPSVAEDPSCSGAMHVKSVEVHMSSRYRRGDASSEVSSSSPLTMVHIYEIRRQKLSSS